MGYWFSAGREGLDHDGTGLVAMTFVVRAFLGSLGLVSMAVESSVEFPENKHIVLRVYCPALTA